MIVSFRCPDTAQLYRHGRCSKRFRAIEQQAITRLLRLDAATSLGDLAAIPGNRLEALRGDRAGQHSIRINDQWRICFRWEEKNAYAVEIADYH